MHNAKLETKIAKLEEELARAAENAKLASESSKIASENAKIEAENAKIAAENAKFLAEKERLRELELRAAQEQHMVDSQGEDSDEQHHLSSMGMLGGIAMQREDSNSQTLPIPPPRPLSAASSTGSTGR